MEKTIKLSKIELGDTFSKQEKVQTFVPDVPPPFDPEYADRIMRESEARTRRRQKLNSARNYRKLFTRLTSKDWTVDLEMQFSILEEQYGKTLIREAIEYMAMKNLEWAFKPFMVYLLKSLQGLVKEHGLDHVYKTAEDEAIYALDRALARETKKHLLEIKRWERWRAKEIGEQGVSTVEV